MARLRRGDPGHVFVTADRQTGGRGRQGRTWSSPVGNLYASLALRDPAPVALAPQLGFVAGVALATTLRDRLGGDDRLRLKWPNDVLFDGAKLAGILLESASLADGRLGCVVGFGVNCVSHPSGLSYPAIDLRAAGDADVEPSEVLAQLARNIDGELARWQKGERFADVRERWLAMAAGRGEQIVVATPRHTFSGIFRDLDAGGRLLVELPDGMATVDAGDVFLSSPTRNSNLSYADAFRSRKRGEFG